MKKLDDELDDLQNRLSEMADLARSMVVLAANAVKDRTFDAYAQMSESESKLDQMQTDIDHEAIRLLTVYGPVASDLRYLLVSTHVTSQLERMGDQAVNVCEALRLMRSDPAQQPTLANVRKMGDLACQMVDDALDAFFSRNEAKAVTTRRRDDVVDAMNHQVAKELLTDEAQGEVSPQVGGTADVVAQILTARCLERIADQAKNICKQVVYLVSAEDVRHVRPQ